MKRFGFHPD
jgi:ribosomal protein L23